RAFSDQEYIDSGANVSEDLSEAPVIFAVKEIPISLFQPRKTYVFFAHVIKGQKYNMPMLKKMMELGCNLIDYEKITDEHGRRLVFFGHYAGLAGMFDTLWAFGKRMEIKGIETPFNEIKEAINYKDLNDIKDHLKMLGERIARDGLPDDICPMVVGFAGYGNVSRGAQEILDLLPVEEITPEQLKTLSENYSNNVIYKVVFKEKDMVDPISPDANFDLQEYYSKPELYKPTFEQYLPYLTILMNCIYWEKRYPRLITKDYVERNYNQMKLEVIGDISVDVNGAIEFTEKTTDSGCPTFVYNPSNKKITDGYEGEGIVVMAVDNLPCELPRESSEAFSKLLFDFVPPIAKADYSVDFDSLDLPPEVKRAVILYHGKLAPDYEYISKYL
ncbi:MAG: hypothetical protein DRO67_04010, partial [Candidatus Asgardarchaeum californiense]